MPAMSRRPPTTTTRPARRSSAWSTGAGSRLERQLHPEGRALAEGAAHADPATHQLHQLAGDVEPEATAADAASDALLAAREPLEQPRLRLWRQADAGVLDGKPQAHFGLAPRHGLDLHHDLAAFGELDGVADKVDQRLMQLSRASAQPVGRIGAKTKPQRQALGGGQMPEQHAQPQQAVVEVEGLDLDGKTALLDLGQVQDLIDQVEQAVRGRSDRAGHVALFRVQPRLGQQLAHADDRVQRGAQLVAHRREEVALGAAGLLSPRDCVGQLAQQHGEIGGQDDQRGDQCTREDRDRAPFLVDRHDGAEHHGRDRGCGPKMRTPVAEAVPKDGPEQEGIEGGGRHAADEQGRVGARRVDQQRHKSTDPVDRRPQQDVGEHRQRAHDADREDQRAAPDDPLVLPRLVRHHQHERVHRADHHDANQRLLMLGVLARLQARPDATQPLAEPERAHRPARRLTPRRARTRATSRARCWSGPPWWAAGRAGCAARAARR